MAQQIVQTLFWKTDCQFGGRLKRKLIWRESFMTGTLNEHSLHFLPNCWVNSLISPKRICLRGFASSGSQVEGLNPTFTVLTILSINKLSMVNIDSYKSIKHPNYQLANWMTFITHITKCVLAFYQPCFLVKHWVGHLKHAGPPQSLPSVKPLKWVLFSERSPTIFTAFNCGICDRPWCESYLNFVSRFGMFRRSWQVTDGFKSVSRWKSLPAVIGLIAFGAIPKLRSLISFNRSDTHILVFPRNHRSMAFCLPRVGPATGWSPVCPGPTMKATADFHGPAVDGALI